MLCILIPIFLTTIGSYLVILAHASQLE